MSTDTELIIAKDDSFIACKKQFAALKWFCSDHEVMIPLMSDFSLWSAKVPRGKIKETSGIHTISNWKRLLITVNYSWQVTIIDGKNKICFSWTIKANCV